MKETLSKKETPIIIGAGVIIGIIAVALVYFGNPANMGFCIACFLRDTSGALGFHSAAAVQYIRPEIVGLVLGSCILALATKEFKPRGGSAPVTRFVIGMFVMIGCLMFLGCPFRISRITALRSEMRWRRFQRHLWFDRIYCWNPCRSIFPEKRLYSETFL